MMITKAYDGLLKVEVDLRETWVKKHQFVTRPANVTSYFARSGQTNPIYAALRQEVGLYEERLTSMAQTATAEEDFESLIDPRLLSGAADVGTTDAAGTHTLKKGQTVQEGQAEPATTDGASAHVSQGYQTDQVGQTGQDVQTVVQGTRAMYAPPQQLYHLLGIGSLEMGGRLEDWERAFDWKLRTVLDSFNLGLTWSGDVYSLLESSDNEDSEQGWIKKRVASLFLSFKQMKNSF